MTRRELREHIFKMLFCVEFYQQEQVPEQLESYFDRYESIEEKDRGYLMDKAGSVIEKITELDTKIDEIAQGWKVKRMGNVDKTIIRLALYEILYEENVPTKVAINEAVEIAKIYGGDDSPAFINGILAKLVS